MVVSRKCRLNTTLFTIWRSPLIIHLGAMPKCPRLRPQFSTLGRGKRLRKEVPIEGQLNAFRRPKTLTSSFCRCGQIWALENAIPKAMNGRNPGFVDREI